MSAEFFFTSCRDIKNQLCEQIRADAHPRQTCGVEHLQGSYCHAVHLENLREYLLSVTIPNFLS